MNEEDVRTLTNTAYGLLLRQFEVIKRFDESESTDERIHSYQRLLDITKALIGFEHLLKVMKDGQ
jgi:hypothetical protein